MSNFNQDNNSTESRLVSRTTLTMSPMFLSGNQALQQISLLSPLEEPPKNSQHQQFHTLLTIDTYSCAPAHQIDAKVGFDEVGESPEDRDCYYDQDLFFSPGLPRTVDVKRLPPIPTYHESQKAYHPNGVKRLPHFHPQKFSRRLRTIMDQRRRPQPLSLYIEPIPKSYFSPSPTPCESESASPRPRNSLVQALLRILPHRYSQAHQLEEHEAVEYAQDGCWWREMDHRVIIMGIVGLLLLAFSLGAWAMALYTA